MKDSSVCIRLLGGHDWPIDSSSPADFTSLPAQEPSISSVHHYDEFDEEEFQFPSATLPALVQGRARGLRSRATEKVVEIHTRHINARVDEFPVDAHVRFFFSTVP